MGGGVYICACFIPPSYHEPHLADTSQLIYELELFHTLMNMHEMGRYLGSATTLRGYIRSIKGGRNMPPNIRYTVKDRTRLTGCAGDLGFARSRCRASCE
jgi:hypothetical protein